MRGVYLKAEERISYGKMVWNEGDKCFESGDNHKDFKREWRVKRAKTLLVERFGLPLIRRAIAYAVVVLLILAALVVGETTGYGSTGYPRITAVLQGSVASSIETALAVITGLLAAVAAIVPSFKLAFASSTESNVSRGDVIFKKASTVRDQLGFLAMVKQELQELFDYLREFEKEVGTRIVLVPIIDDLDRCITNGRNVKVLEAMQLILSVPGAPIISFLAVDSRIVVASIEEHYEKVFAHTNVSGHEYLGKIVQLPFALPEPPSQKVVRLLSKALEGDAASPVQVAQRLKVFGAHGRQLLNVLSAPDRAEPKDAATEDAVPRRLTFKVAGSAFAPVDVVASYLLEPLVLTIEKLDSPRPDTANSLTLICAFASELGDILADQISALMVKGNVDVNEEAVEILCRNTNAALEAGEIVLEDVCEHLCACVPGYTHIRRRCLIVVCA